MFFSNQSHLGRPASGLAAALTVLTGLGLMATGSRAADAAKEPDRAAIALFETKVRPLLAENCYRCHGAERHKANLRLDSLHAMLTGGDSGPAIVPGDAEHSLLLQVVSYSDDYVQMPPTRKLPDAQIAALRRWVELGAPWPGADSAEARRPSRPAFEITAKDRAYWFYQPVQRPKVPDSSAAGKTSPIDRFLRAELDKRGLSSNPPAGPRELVRRAYFDLLGLPPAPRDVDAFAADKSPDAYAKLVDRLLASPQYGERWGRHWLDVVRFAQTNGYERDGEKPLAWRYRDNVIKSFNGDKPYDRFVVEQLAGDELPDADDDSRIATGFFRLGVWDDEPDDARMAEFDDLDDVMVTTGAAFMGLTIGCARCHDHMFDPIAQADYYRLLAFFRNIRPYGKNANFDENSPMYLPLGDRAKINRWLADREAQAAPMREKLKTVRDKNERRQLEARLQQAAGPPPFEWALGVTESGTRPKPTHVLIRGNASTPGAAVEPAFPTVLGGQKPEFSPPPAGKSTGLRLALARWLTGRDNPLSARVMVNRIWQHHFGSGIVKTTNDFGRAGIPPTHPELLDWLAAEFMDSGWSVKHMHRVIMLSDAYRMSSRADNPKAMTADAGNDLLWRQNLRRLEAEAIRDTALAASGQLNLAPGGRGFFPTVDAEVLAGASKPGLGWEVSALKDQCRRSVYTFVKRSMLAPSLETFDYSNTVQPLGERPVTTVAPQALLLLNDRFMQTQAAAFAARLLKEAGGDPPAQIERAYALVFNRRPSERERQVAVDFLARQERASIVLAQRLSVRSEVPETLSDGYLRRLAPSDIVPLPAPGWSSYRGKWEGTYEGVKRVDAQRRPFALCNGAVFKDGAINGRVMLDRAAEEGSILFRATPEGDVFRGYELELDARGQVVSLKRHGADVTLLAETDASIPTGTLLPLKIEVAGSRIRVWLGAAEPAIDITDPQPLTEIGRIGSRAWGGAFILDGLHVYSDGREYDLHDVPADAPPPANGDDRIAGWRYFGGRWSAGEGGVRVKPEPGAKIIWDAPRLGDGTVEAEVMLHGFGGDAGIVLRVNQPTDGVDALAAYNVNFRTAGLRLGKHENNWRQLAVAPMKLTTRTWHQVRVELKGGRVRIFVDGAAEPQIDFTDASPLPAGKVGLRTFNADCSFRGLKVASSPKSWIADFKPQKAEPSTVAVPAVGPRFDARRRALESFCLLIFNLNEFVYID